MAGIDDPLGVGAPILQTGAGALDVGFKRMAMEQQAGQAAEKSAQDKAIADAKLKAAKDKELMKAMPASTGTVFLPYKLDYQVKRDELDKARAADLAARERGELTDLQVVARHDARVAALNQYKDYTMQIGKMYENNSKYMLEHPEEFKPGALREYQATVSNVDLANKGILPEDPTHLWDLDKNIRTTFGAMKADTNAWASADGTSSGSDTYILPDHFKGLADQFAAREWAGPSLLEHFKGLSPDRQAFIENMAKVNKISQAAATAMDYAMNLYDAKTEVRKTEQQSETTAGNSNQAAMSQELIGTMIGTSNGTVKGIGLQQAFPSGTKQDLEAFKAANPNLASTLDKLAAGEPEGDLKFVNNLAGRLNMDTHTDEQGHKIPSKLVGFIVNEKTGKMVAVHATDGEFASNKLRTSGIINPDETYQKILKVAQAHTPGMPETKIMDKAATAIYGEQKDFGLGKTDFGGKVYPDQSKVNPYAKKPSIQSVKDDPYAKR